MTPPLQVWSDFFEEIDQEAKAQAAIARRAHPISQDRYQFPSTSWMNVLLEIQHRKQLARFEPDTFLPSSMDQQTSLQCCLTQALCILEEVKDTPAVSGMDSQFGDFRMLLSLLEEANQHLQAMMTE